MSTERREIGHVTAENGDTIAFGVAGSRVIISVMPGARTLSSAEAAKGARYLAECAVLAERA